MPSPSLVDTRGAGWTVEAVLTPLLRYAIDDRIRRWADLRSVDHVTTLTMTTPVLVRLAALSQPFRSGVTTALLVSSVVRAPFSSGSSSRALPVLALADRWIEVTACALVTERNLTPVTITHETPTRDATAHDPTAHDAAGDIS